MLVILKKDGLYYGKEKVQDERDLMWRWNSVLEVEDEVTFGDLINYLYADELIMNTVSLLTQTDLLEYKDEFDKDAVDDGQLQSIEIARNVYLQGPQLIHGPYALGVFTEPRVNEDLGVTDRVCSLGFASWNELKNLPLKINKLVEHYDGFLPENTETCITLGEALSALFEELGFYGNPTDRQNTQEDLEERMRKVENGEVEFYTWEEVQERLKAKLEEKNATK